MHRVHVHTASPRTGLTELHRSVVRKKLRACWGRRALTVTIGTLALVATVVDARVTPESKCMGAKARATGMRALELLKAFAVDEKKPNPGKLARAVSKAEVKFTKAFSNAERKGACAIGPRNPM